jgi:hypothetical protein
VISTLRPAHRTSREWGVGRRLVWGTLTRRLQGQGHPDSAKSGAARTGQSG